MPQVAKRASALNSPVKSKQVIKQVKPKYERLEKRVAVVPSSKKRISKRKKNPKKFGDDYIVSTSKMLSDDDEKEEEIGLSDLEVDCTMTQYVPEKRPKAIKKGRWTIDLARHKMSSHS